MGIESMLGLSKSDNEEEKKEETLDVEGANEKAYIIVLEACTIDGGEYSEVISYEEGQMIPAQFNPTEYSIKINSKYDPEKSGISQNSDTFGMFSPPEPCKLSVTLLYDSVIQVDYLDKVKDVAGAAKKALTGMTMSLSGVMSAATDIYDAYSKYDNEEDLNQTYIEAILGLGKLSLETGRPPLIGFSYGSTKFIGYMESVDVHFMRFNKTGEVIRAEISIVINEAMDHAEEKDVAGAVGGASSSDSKDIVTDDPIGLSDLFG